MAHKGVEEVEGVAGVSQAIRIFEPVAGEKEETRIEMRVVFDVGNPITGVGNAHPRKVSAAGVEQRGIARVVVMTRAMVIREGANPTEGKKLNVLLPSTDTRKSCKMIGFLVQTLSQRWQKWPKSMRGLNFVFW